MSKLESALAGNGETRGKRVSRGHLVAQEKCAFLRIAPQTWMTIAVAIMLRSMLPGGAAAISSDAMCSIIARAALKSEILLPAANEMGRRRNKSEKSQNER